MDSERLQWIDSVKGVGMLLIMLVHMNAIPIGTEWLTAGYVSMFFVLSGMTFRERDNIPRDILRKVKRLLVPYAFYTLSIVALTAMMAIVVGKPYDIWHKLAGIAYSRRYITPTTDETAMLLNGGCAPLWFMTSLFTAYLLVYLWQWSKHNTTVITLYLILAINAANIPCLLPWSIDMAALGAMLIITGTHYSTSLKSDSHDHWWPLVLAVYIAMVWYNGSTNMSLSQYGDRGMASVVIFMVLAVMECWLISVVCRKIAHTKAESVLAYVGRHSLRLMCIHMFVWLTFKDMLLSRLGEMWHWALVIVALIVIFVANHLISKICERLKRHIPIAEYL